MHSSFSANASSCAVPKNTEKRRSSRIGSAYAYSSYRSRTTGRILPRWSRTDARCACTSGRSAAQIRQIRRDEDQRRGEKRNIAFRMDGAKDKIHPRTCFCTKRLVCICIPVCLQSQPRDGKSRISHGNRPHIFAVQERTGENAAPIRLHRNPVMLTRHTRFAYGRYAKTIFHCTAARSKVNYAAGSAFRARPLRVRTKQAQKRREEAGACKNQLKSIYCC